MTTNKNTVADRRRKGLLVLPLVVIPFLTLMFWSLGGGTKAVASNMVAEKKGMNTNLPDANNETLMDKMSYYKKAMQDSSKKNDMVSRDDIFGKGLNMTMEGQPGSPSALGGAPPANPQLGYTYKDPNETKIYDKLNTLNQVLNQPGPGQPTPVQNPYANAQSTTPSVNSADIDRLESMMKTMQGDGSGQDPEMGQINGMLEKILDIQHPERVKDKLKEFSKANRGRVYAVSTSTAADPVSLLARPEANGGKDSPKIKLPVSNGFFSLDEGSNVEDGMAGAIPAVIHETQVLVEGSTVKLRLTKDVMVNGVVVPKDNFVFGTAKLSGERLTISIPNIRYGNFLFPVALTAFDLDGMDGIYIPDAISRNVAKESVDGAVQGLSMTSMDPSLGAQAASAGIEAARTLIGKKVKLIKVTVKAGYQVLLRDGNDNR